MKMQSLLVVFGVVLFVVVGVALAGGSESKKNLASEVETLKTQVAALQKQAQASQDYIAISNLQTAYGYYVDKCKWDEAADLFAKDSTLEIGLRGVYVGQDRVRAYLHKLPDLKYGTLFNHMQLQPKIDIAPDGLTAQGRWRAIMQVGILHRSAQWGEARTSTPTSPTTPTITRAGTRAAIRPQARYPASPRIVRQPKPTACTRTSMSRRTTTRIR